MTQQTTSPEDRAELRRRAEQRARSERSRVPEEPEGMPAEALRAAFHELAVHQIELELQNEELRRVHEELDTSRARYFELYALAPVGYCTLDEAGRIAEANHLASQLVGVDRASLVGQPFPRFIFPADQDTYYLGRKALLATGAPQSFELRVGHGAGDPVWVWVTMASHTPEGNQAPVCLLVLVDITRRKAAEAQQEALRLQLEQAEHLEALGTLAGGVAHDFNNILAGILGWLSVLELDDEPVASREDVREVKALVERGADLARQLLGFARRGKYDVRPLSLPEMVEKTGRLFARTRPDLALILALPADLPAVLMDRAQLEQVLLNLLVNAGQAMPEGGRIQVEARPLHLDAGSAPAAGVAPGDYVELRLTDSGEGMDAATQARIFEPFFTTKGVGTGLGLASAYGIITNHGGSIAVESAPGRGTTFTLRLPAARTPPPAPAPSPEVKAEVHPGAGTVLLVDDEPTVLRMHARVLTRLGYTVLTAAGGREAVSLLRHHGSAISLVILDMTMPEMSGSQTFDALRAIDPGIKVLLASGHAARGKAQEILDRGCNGFIQKPFDPATLAAKIEEIA